MTVEASCHCGAVTITVASALMSGAGGVALLDSRVGNSTAASYRQEIAREMTAADVASAQRAAREWLTCH